MDCFMVELTLPEILSKEYILQIPKQKKLINKLILKGIISSYTVAYDRSRIWIVVKVKSISSCKKVLQMMPIYRFTNCSIYEIAIHKIISQIHMHHLCLN